MATHIVRDDVYAGPIPATPTHAGVAQWKSAGPTLQRWGFDSLLPYYGRVAQLGRGGGPKPRAMQVRILPRPLMRTVS